MTAPVTVRPVDGTLVGLAVAVGVLLTVGLAVSEVLDRAGPSGGELALDALAALVPAVVATVLLQRPGDRGLRSVTLALAGVGLAVVATGIGERPSAAALAAPPVLVLVACRPRLPTLVLPRWWRPAGGGALAALLVVGLLAGPGAPGAGDPLILTSGTLDDGQEAIGVVDARFLSDTLGLADRVTGARCYFLAEGELYADVVACGPVVHRPEPAPAAGDEGVDEGDEADEGLGEDPGELDPGSLDPEVGPGVWDLYPVRADGGDLRLTGDPGRGQEIDDGLLHRPDGLRPPGDRPEDRAELPVDPGFAVAPFDQPGRARSAGGFVLAGTGRVAVTALAEPSTVADEDGLERRAPDGYRLVAFELAFEAVAGTTLEVVSGGDRVDVTAVVSDGGEAYQDGWVVAVDRDDGIDPLLEVTHRGRGQRLSLETGERLGGHPLLYRPRSQTLELPVESVTVPVQVPRPTPHPAEVGFSDYTIVRADLVVFDENLGWAPPGQAWLAVALSGLDEPSFFDSEGDGDIDPLLRFDAGRSFRLTLADRTELPPAAVRPAVDVDLAAVFPVHEDTRTATFRSAPGWLLSLGDDGIEVTAPAVEVPLAL